MNAYLMKRKISYFPKSYESEYIYSLISRFAAHTGQANSVNVLNELFSEENTKSDQETKESIKALSSNIAELNPIYSNDYLIAEHTLANFFLPFCDESSIQRTNICKDLDHQFHSPTTTQLNKKRQIFYIKICLSCKINNLKKYGEEYFIREHQIDGVMYCYKHNERLQFTDLSYSKFTQGSRKAPSYKPTFPYQIKSDIERHFDPTDLERYISISSSELLNFPFEAIITKKQWVTFYKSTLVNSFGSIENDESPSNNFLCFTNWFVSSAIDTINSSRIKYSPYFMLQIVSGITTTFHPVQHLIAWHYLFPKKKPKNILTEIQTIEESSPTISTVVDTPLKYNSAICREHTKILDISGINVILIINQTATAFTTISLENLDILIFEQLEEYLERHLSEVSFPKQRKRSCILETIGLTKLFIDGICIHLQSLYYLLPRLKLVRSILE